MADARAQDRPSGSAEELRLRLRVDELNAALREKHDEFLTMLDRLQQREEEAVQRALAELARAEQRFESILYSAGEGIIGLDGSGRISFVNPAATQILGHRQEHLLGRDHHSIIHHTYPDGQPYPAAACPILAVLAGEDTRAVEREVFWRGDGTSVAVEYTVTPVRQHGHSQGTVVAFRDITERLEYQRTLEETAAELEATVEELSERRREAEAARAAAERAERRATFLADASSTLAGSLDHARTLEQVARLVVSSLADWCIMDVLEETGEVRRLVVSAADPADMPLTREFQRRTGLDMDGAGALALVLRTGESKLYPKVTLKQIGRIADSDEERRLLRRMRPRSFMIVPLVARGRVIGAISLATTKSARRLGSADRALVEELARRTALALDNARLYAAALVANRAKSDFMAVMSHELRTPLNAIIGYGDLLLAGVPAAIPETARTQVQRIRSAARHLLELIEEILSFSRIEAQQESLALTTVDLADLLADVGGLVEPLAQEKGLAFGIESAPQSLEMETDPGKIRQILLNLLSNAVKFTPRGEVTLRAWAEVDEVVLEVSDTGIGIAAEHVPRIFDPFWQVEQGATRRKGGTGLGLSVTRSLARLLGGEVSVRSEPGKGTTFTVRLPMRTVGGIRERA